MTAIAFDGDTIASDSCASHDWVKKGTTAFRTITQKIKPTSFRGMETIWARSGDNCVSHFMMSYLIDEYHQGRKHKYPKWDIKAIKKEFKGEYFGNVAIFWPQTDEWLIYESNADGCSVFEPGQPFILNGDPIYHFMKGAMQHKATAIEAVSLACNEFDSCDFPLYAWSRTNRQIRRIDKWQR